MTNDFQQILQMGQQVQARMAQLQDELGQRTISCSSGGGMVTVTADGKGRMKSIQIDRAVVDPSDIDMLEDLVLAAVSEAQNRASALYEEEMRKLSGGFSLPFQIPGL
jgi:DNA-binding YbaB/EbfC family protein